MAMNEPLGTSGTERALLDYLDGLLHDADELPPRAAPVREMAANVTPLPNLRATRIVEPLQTFAEPRANAEPRPFAEPARLRMPLPPVAPPVTEAVVVEKVVVKAPAPEPVPVIEVKAPVVEVPAPVVPSPIVEMPVEVVAEPPAPVIGGRPAWAEQPFECLLFKAGGLTLAVPLVELGSIYPLEDGDITEIFGQIDWFLGLMHTKYGNVRVVDSARVVMPERYSDEMAAGYHYVLTLNESDWGLGIDEVVGTTQLDPEAVKWRSDRSKRAWLAGTVVEQMCALLDVAQMRVMFDQQDKKRRDREPAP